MSIMKSYLIITLMVFYWGGVSGQYFNNTLYADPNYQSALKNHKLGKYDLVLSYLHKIDTAGLGKDLSLWAEYQWLLSDSYNQVGKKDTAGMVYNSILPILLNSQSIKYDSVWSELFYDICIFYIDSGVETIASQLIERGLDLAISTNGENSTEWAKFISLLGYLKSRAIGDYDTGVQLLRKSLYVWLENKKEKHIEAARIYSKLSHSELNRKNRVLAVKYAQKSLEIYSSINTRNKHKLIANSYASLASIFYRYDEYDTAISYYLKAIDIMKEMPPSLSSAIMNNYSSIGDCYYQKGDYSKALDYYKIALRLHEKAFGPMHPKLGVIYGNILAILIKLGRFEEGEAFSKKINSIVILKKNWFAKI